uniref:Uncharacterized protein n=1 Tax=Oryza sativa subsp. japonica TaxID=39947 RepID=Q6ZAK8_ORYSJ|nr:hypothetical protein [Oryza sativa Japonica Group]
MVGPTCHTPSFSLPLSLSLSLSWSVTRQRRARRHAWHDVGMGGGQRRAGAGRQSECTASHGQVEGMGEGEVGGHGGEADDGRKRRRGEVEGMGEWRWMGRWRKWRGRAGGGHGGEAGDSARRRGAGGEAEVHEVEAARHHRPLGLSLPPLPPL